MYADILLSTDGSDVARKGVKHGIALAKALNAKVTVIAVTEPLPVDHGSGHASGWIPSQEEVDRFDAGSVRAKRSMKLELWRSRAGYLQNSCMFPMRIQPLRLSKRQSPEAAG
jgi:nucleotide-binding universal stress UspA family protein